MTYRYISTAQNFFDSWRIWFYIFVFLIAVSIIGDIAFPINMLVFSMGVALIVVVLIMLFRITVVKRESQHLYCSSIEGSAWLKNIKTMETWWSYDFKSGDPVYAGDGATGKSQQLINYIYIYARVDGSNGSVVLYELIQLSSKFPNNHKYKTDYLFENIKMIKVYDVDHCIKKLKLDQLQIIDPKVN